MLATQASSALSARAAGSTPTPNRPRSRPDSTRSSGPARALIALFRSATPGADATSAEFQGAIADGDRRPGRDPHVSGVIGYAETGDMRFISTAGDAAYIVIQLDRDRRGVGRRRRRLRAAIVAPAGYTYQLTGYGPITKDGAEQSEKCQTMARSVVARGEIAYTGDLPKRTDTVLKKLDAFAERAALWQGLTSLLKIEDVDQLTSRKVKGYEILRDSPIDIMDQYLEVDR